MEHRIDDPLDGTILTIKEINVIPLFEKATHTFYR
jgi:hypothetical protein